MRGTKRKPSNILKLSGAFAKNPSRGRARADEPESRGELGDPPGWMTDAQRVAWIELRGYMHAGVCCEADRPMFTATAILYKQVCEPDCPLPVILALMKALASFGMTPADRSRVKVTNKPQAADPWDEFKK